MGHLKDANAVKKWGISLQLCYNTKMIPECHIVKNRWFGLFYLFNGISTANGLSNAEIWFISKYLLWS